MDYTVVITADGTTEALDVFDEYSQVATHTATFTRAGHPTHRVNIIAAPAADAFAWAKLIASRDYLFEGFAYEVTRR